MRKRPKYGNIRTVINGVAFDSKREARRWQELQLLEKAGEIRHLERQMRFPLHAARSGEQIGCYVADHTYEERSSGGWQMVVEDSKGVRTELYKWKRRHMKAEHGIEIREV